MNGRECGLKAAVGDGEERVPVSVAPTAVCSVDSDDGFELYNVSDGDEPVLLKTKWDREARWRKELDVEA
ncbi:hypothetical protein SARC_03146 [Sphaeroforma arctica JP610]|uniref:Uncharacterized protein n=1 Tax=Sphaeroforma arctica JP610 TaxID=667725 RepID=A0A0L0G6L0_9EUKA|nr:hypothetical protein SARC_03146 [Sphaeroforma arctica JP610]KNC84655.1 hypothetical protein SARC_03146 [Sphaeroforma arctica JP610]|eukprot:XP_014158557.1 hypothetical protein SARC_03146 [Sphaeroforma arctica JP610]